MNLWTLEMARLWRTRRLIALLAVYIVLGLGLPVLTYELPSLVKHSTPGVTIIAPPPTAVSSLAGFASNSAQLGTLVLVIVAAAATTLDARPALAAFYRSRTRLARRLLLPRLGVLAVAAAISLAAGVGCCWYETEVLIGPIRAGPLAAGYAIELLWITLCLALVAAYAARTASIAAAAGTTIATLLALSFLGAIGPLAPWLPTHLATGLSSFSGPKPSGADWKAIAATSVSTLGLLSAAARFAHHQS